MAIKKRKIFFVEMANRKIAWRAPEDAYTSAIATDLGVKEASDSEQGIELDGSIRPPRVRINTDKSKSYTRYCDGSKLEDVVVKGTLRGKSYGGGKITTVTAVKG
jgi:hypothetical protein